MINRRADVFVFVRQDQSVQATNRLSNVGHGHLFRVASEIMEVHGGNGGIFESHAPPAASVFNSFRVSIRNEDQLPPKAIRA